MLKYNPKLKQLKLTHDKGSISKALFFFLGSIGTKNSIFNSGTTIPLVPVYENYTQGNYQQFPEYKIDFKDRFLLPTCLEESRKLFKIQNIIEDENDEDWSFVPKAILDHRKRIIPRYVIKMYENNNLELKLERNEHLRLKVLWKDVSISWIA